MGNPQYEKLLLKQMRKLSAGGKAILDVKDT